MYELDYEKINEYLNNVSVNMFESNDFKKNFVDITQLNDYFYNYFKYSLLKDGKYSRVSSKNDLSSMDIINLAREIIETIDTSLLDEFDNLLKSDRLAFEDNNKYTDSFLEIRRKNGVITKSININRQFNYNDVKLLVHEFMHYITPLHYGFKNKIITEFIAIYFETYANEYIYKKYQVDLNELFYEDRIISTFYITRKLMNIELPLMAYIKYGNLNEESYKNVDENIISYEDYDYYYDCSKIFELEKKDNSYEREENEIVEYTLEKDYYYFLATMLAFYARKKFDMKDIINFAKNISMEETEKNDFIELLKKYNLNLEEDFFYTPVDSINEYLEIFNKKQGKTI